MNEEIDLEAWAADEIERLTPLVNDPTRTEAERILDTMKLQAACAVFGVDCEVRITRN